MRFKNSPQLSGAGRTRAGHHHGSHTPTSPEAVLLGKMAHHTKQIRRECMVSLNFKSHGAFKTLINFWYKGKEGIRTALIFFKSPILTQFEAVALCLFTKCNSLVNFGHKYP